MAGYKPKTPIGYGSSFRTMADVYRRYISNVAESGSYKPHSAVKSYAGYHMPREPKYNSPEHRPVSEGEDRAQQAESKQDKSDAETHNNIEEPKQETTENRNPEEESNKDIESDQEKTEHEDTDEKTDDDYGRADSDLEFNSYDSTSRKRPSPYNDRSETRW